MLERSRELNFVNSYSLSLLSISIYTWKNRWITRSCCQDLFQFIAADSVPVDTKRNVFTIKDTRNSASLMDTGMEHLKFFEEQAKKDANSSRITPTSNRCENEQSNGVNDKPKLKKITDDMPKWKREKLVKENEKIKEEIKRMEERESEEQKKWIGLPPWKIKILKEKETLQKEKDEEERRMRKREEIEKKEWEALPPWKRSLLAMKGFTRITKKIEEKELTVNHVTRADSADNESDNSSDIAEDDGDNSEDSIGGDNMQQVEEKMEDETTADEDDQDNHDENDDQENNNQVNGDLDDDEASNDNSEEDKDNEEVEEEDEEEDKEEVKEERVEEEVKMEEQNVPPQPAE